jgi:hypothetical protein
MKTISIDRNKFGQGDKIETLKLLWAIDKNKFKNLAKTQGLDVSNELELSELIELIKSGSKDFDIDLFLRLFKTNSKEIAKAKKRINFK